MKLLLLLLFPLIVHALEFDCVKNEKSAVNVGEALLVSIYGESVLKQRPFKVKSSKKTWILEGTLPCKKGDVCLGGVAMIEFNKHDSQVVKFIHSK